jgi:transporter family protein
MPKIIKLSIIIAAEMWIILGIFSAAFLGFHEIFKKTSLNNNAVLPVLFLGSASSAVLFIPLLLFSSFHT